MLALVQGPAVQKMLPHRAVTEDRQEAGGGDEAERALRLALREGLVHMRDVRSPVTEKQESGRKRGRGRVGTLYTYDWNR